MEPVRTRRLTAPDGGYGWVIVLAVFLQIAVPLQLMPLFGVLFGPKFEEFNASPTEISSIYSVFIVFLNLITIFVGPLGELRSERFVAVCATLVQVTGIVICVFSTSTIHLVLGLGVICGSGIGISSINNVIIVNKYFKNKVGLALGIAISAIGIFGLAVPQVIKNLIPNFDIQYVILMYAAMALIAGLAGALLMQPVTKHLVPVEEEEVEDDPFLITREDFKPKEKEQTTCSKWPICTIFSHIKWSLLKDPFFLMIASGNSICVTSYMIQVSEISLIAKARNLSLDQRADLLSILSATDIISRFIQGFLADLSCLANIFQHPKKFLFTICSLCLAGTMTAMAFAQTFQQLVFLVCLTSLFNSCLMLNSTQIYRECFSSYFSSALGLSSLFRAFFALTMGPLAGYLKEYFQDFRASLFFLSISSSACMLCWILMDCRSTQSRHKGSEQKEIHNLTE